MFTKLFPHKRAQNITNYILFHTLSQQICYLFFMVSGIVISQLNEKYNNDLQAKKDTSDMAEVITGFTRL